MPRLVDLYPYRFIEDTPQFFVAKRAKNKMYAGQWRMVGGKVKPGETAWQAALRELNEELSVDPERFWSPPTLNQFYEPSTDMIHQIPVFAAELNRAPDIRLNEEHTRYK